MDLSLANGGWGEVMRAVISKMAKLIPEGMIVGRRQRSISEVDDNTEHN